MERLTAEQENQIFEKLSQVIYTAFVFCRAIAVPKSQMPVFPPNPRLAKLSIEPIELIDDVDGW
jgi:hypothetical protein